MSTVARRTRVVSARELSRRMASLLDEMESDEVALIVMRYGRPSAMLVPFEENGGAPKLPRLADLGEFELARDVDEQAGDVRLEPIQERILVDMAHCTDRFWRIDRMSHEKDRGAVWVALTRLELDGFIEREWHGGIQITRKGSRLVRRLNSTK